MRYLVAGTDADGRSVIESDAARTGPIDRLATFDIYRGPSTPTGLPRPANAEFLDIAPAAGNTTWKVVEFPAGHGYAAHYTNSVDFSAVVAGAVDFTVDSGTEHLEAGDCVLVRGAGHRWSTEHGCRMLVAMLGAVPEIAP